jgi:hypothetical protein
MRSRIHSPGHILRLAQLNNILLPIPIKIKMEREI